MSSNHLKTAREWGAQQALEQAGYKNVGDLIKEAEDLGLVEKRASNTGANIGGLAGNPTAGAGLGSALGAAGGSLYGSVRGSREGV
jgi:hypothetical protein